MTSGMPELGSKISLISKADIRYEGRLFTVDPAECTIALANGTCEYFFSHNFLVEIVHFFIYILQCVQCECVWPNWATENC